jgi:hypothetical protein
MRKALCPLVAIDGPPRIDIQNTPKFQHLGKLPVHHQQKSGESLSPVSFQLAKWDM